MARKAHVSTCASLKRQILFQTLPLSFIRPLGTRKIGKRGGNQSRKNLGHLRLAMIFRSFAAIQFSAIANTRQCDQEPHLSIGATLQRLCSFGCRNIRNGIARFYFHRNGCIPLCKSNMKLNVTGFGFGKTPVYQRFDDGGSSLYSG
ncbi:hypothetical protein [uncultured Sphingorhabdus sp.]|uniref:hypothetical protein n=1 Tax=uncultured Sphingorhabdus sp. TaxID=1686106 RepID=UPI0026254139|nr:hypothetical protein [uncultured Sphingorhabdus sp.]